MKKPIRLKGVIPPIVTPLDEVGAVDVTSLERLVNFELDAGVHAIFALGTGGEGPYLTTGQKEVVLATVTKVVAGRVPVLAGVSDIGTNRTLENLAIASRYDIDGVVSTAPFYGEVEASEIEAHYRGIAAATDLPVFAYDIPSKVGAKLPAAMIVKLAREGVIGGVKDSSGDEDAFRTIIEETADLEKFSVITGSDITGDAAILQGAHGMIVGVANVDPHGFVRVYEAAMAGDWLTARREQERLHRIRAIALVARPRVSSFSATIGSFKTAMQIRGTIDHDTLQPPLQRLNSDERARVGEILVAAGLH